MVKWLFVYYQKLTSEIGTLTLLNKYQCKYGVFRQYWLYIFVYNAMAHNMCSNNMKWLVKNVSQGSIQCVPLT